MLMLPLFLLLLLHLQMSQYRDRDLFLYRLGMSTLLSLNITTPPGIELLFAET